MEDETDKIIIIDFPQMVSRLHVQADEYFERDLECVNDFFYKRFKFQKKVETGIFKDIPYKHHLDQKLKASGYNHQSGNTKDDVLSLYYKQTKKKEEDQVDYQEEEEEEEDSVDQIDQSEDSVDQNDNQDIEFNQKGIKNEDNNSDINIDDQDELDFNQDEFNQGINKNDIDE